MRLKEVESRARVSNEIPASMDVANARLYSAFSTYWQLRVAEAVQFVNDAAIMLKYHKNGEIFSLDIHAPMHAHTDFRINFLGKVLQ